MSAIATKTIKEGVEFVSGNLLGGDAADAAAEAGRLQAGAIGRSAEINAEAQREVLAALQNQLGITRENFAPFLEAGRGAIGGVVQGSTLGGIDEILNQILSGGAFSGLVDERRRGVEGQLAAGGLTRSGTAIEEAAAIPTDLAFQLESMLFGRQSNLMQTGLSAAAQTGGQQGALTGQMGQAITQGGIAAGQGITGAAQAQAAGMLGGAQARQQGIQNLLNLGGTLGAAALMSDPRLKQNIEVVGKVGPLDLVTWEWIPELDESIVSSLPTIGYLSTQVRDHFPQHILEFGGYDAINYKELNEELTWH